MKLKLLLFVLVCIRTASTAQSTTYAFDSDPCLVITHLELSKHTVIDTSFLLCTFKLRVVSDTLQPSVKTRDIMQLQIGHNYSKFYSQLLYLNDSLCTELQNKTTNLPINDPGLQSYQIFRIKNDLRVTNRLPYSNIVYTYSEKAPNLNWQISTDTCTVIGYKCQKASVEFRGRKYVAWFTPDIPINLGPWKFNGLPGLILKIADIQNHYSFECIGIKKEKTCIKNYKWKEKTITLKEWLNLEKKIYLKAGEYLKNSNIKMKVRKNDSWVNVEGDFAIPYNPIEKTTN